MRACDLVLTHEDLFDLFRELNFFGILVVYFPLFAQQFLTELGNRPFFEAKLGGPQSQGKWSMLSWLRHGLWTSVLPPR